MNCGDVPSSKLPIPIFLICNGYRLACQFVTKAWGLDV